MPISKGALKKMRKDKIRTQKNKKKKLSLKALIKKVRLLKTAENLQAVFSAIDKAAKVHLIHRNRASRLKSRLSKLATQPSQVSAAK